MSWSDKLVCFCLRCTTLFMSEEYLQYTFGVISLANVIIETLNENMLATDAFSKDDFKDISSMRTL